MTKKYLADGFMFIIYNTIKYTVIIAGTAICIWLLFGSK